MATTTAAPKKKSQGFQGVRHAFIIIVLAFIEDGHSTISSSVTQLTLLMAIVKDIH